MPLLTSRGRSRHRFTIASICIGLTLSGCAEDKEPVQVPPRVAFVEPLQRIDNGPESLRFPGVVESVTSTQLASISRTKRSAVPVFSVTMEAVWLLPCRSI